MVVVMYTLRREHDGLLHGPLNKRVWGTFGGRKRAALWARAEATKRGFGPQTKKTVQIVLDGANGLRNNMSEAFPKAILTIDVCHVVEKLWDLGHRFHKEGSAEVKAWVEELKELVYQGRCRDAGETVTDVAEASADARPGNQGTTAGPEKTDRLPEAAIEDDAVSQMDIGGLRHCQWSSGRSGAARCWRTDRYRRHALDT